MAVIYITEQGASIRKKDRRLSVVKGKETLYEVPVFQVERILVFGYVQISSQALDMIEEFRAMLVDRFIINLTNRQMFKISDFIQRNDGAMVLKEEQFKKYLDLFEKRMNEEFVLDGENTTWRKLFQRQVRRLEKSVMADIEYVSFVGR